MEDLSPGTRVVVSGLSAGHRLNGARGVVMKHEEVDQGYQVLLDEEEHEAYDRRTPGVTRKVTLETARGDRAAAATPADCFITGAGAGQPEPAAGPYAPSLTPRLRSTQAVVSSLETEKHSTS
jgi:hypothetical protein